jgi:hypothetical protein
MMDEMVAALGFSRRGVRIERTIQSSIRKVVTQRIASTDGTRRILYPRRHDKGCDHKKMQRDVTK